MLFLNRSTFFAVLLAASFSHAGNITEIIPAPNCGFDVSYSGAYGFRLPPGSDSYFSSYCCVWGVFLSGTVKVGDSCSDIEGNRICWQGNGTYCEGDTRSIALFSLYSFGWQGQAQYVDDVLIHTFHFEPVNVKVEKYTKVLGYDIPADYRVTAYQAGNKLPVRTEVLQNGVVLAYGYGDQPDLRFSAFPGTLTYQSYSEGCRCESATAKTNVKVVGAKDLLDPDRNPGGSCDAPITVKVN